MEEAKEYIITADSSAEIREEAIKSLLTNGIDRLQFNVSTTMGLRDEDSQTVRTLMVNGNTVIVSEDAYIDFVDEYFRIKAETEEWFWETILNDKKAGEIQVAEMWKEAGYEYPFNNN